MGGRQEGRCEGIETVDEIELAGAIGRVCLYAWFARLGVLAHEETLSD